MVFKAYQVKRVYIYRTVFELNFKYIYQKYYSEVCVKCVFAVNYLNIAVGIEVVLNFQVILVVKELLKK